MGGRLENKVAFITGVARGQGRAHAVRMAEEGADIIGIDICESIPMCHYPLATPEDLAETERLVKERGRGFVGRIADVRDRPALKDAVEEGVRQFGHLDVVVAQAAICPMAQSDDPLDFITTADVDLTGVLNTLAVTVPHLPDGASIVITGSVAAQYEGTVQGQPGGAGYSWAKMALGSLTERFAIYLAPRMIRINCIHPTNVNTTLIHNDVVYGLFCPDIENPTREQAVERMAMIHNMAKPWLEPEDVANFGVFLASDESRYVSGRQIRIDLGGTHL
jgi:SDR family mycofactocin-dependent oxidoreductase